MTDADRIALARILADTWAEAADEIEADALQVARGPEPTALGEVAQGWLGQARAMRRCSARLRRTLEIE